MIQFVIPIRTVSPANLRVHWCMRARRAKDHRSAAGLVMRSKLTREPIGDGPICVTLTRCAPRSLDSDNLATSCKGVRDGIADGLGIDDGDERITWVYKQQKAKDYSIRVEMEER